MKKYILLLLLLITFQYAHSQTPLDTALNFTVKDIYGEQIELFPILDEGKFVVIDFFSTSCSFCLLYSPDFQASFEDFGENSSNVYFMKIAWGDDNQGVAYFDSIYGYTTPSVSGIQGGGNQVYNNYEVGSTPTVILIAPDRTILEKYIWKPTQENINAAIIAAGGSMVGVEDQVSEIKNSLNVYPNPSRGLINVSFVAKDPAHYQLEAYNLLGSKVYSSVPGNLNEGTHILEVDLGSLPEGTYFVRLVRNGNHDTLSKIILLD